MFGPRLSGERCTLEPPTREDALSRARWQAEPEIARFAWMPGLGAPSVAQIEKQFDDAVKGPDGVVWMIAVDGKRVGMTFVIRINWPARHGYHGYVIGDPALWGKGIGGEASGLACGFAFAELRLNKVKAEVASEHAPSRRVLEKVGFRECGMFRQEYYAEGRYYDMVWYELLKSDWEAHRS